MRIKLTEEAKRIEKLTGISFIPERATPMSAGLDLKACILNRIEIPPETCYQIPAGVHIWLDTPNLAGMLYPRSSCKQFVLMNTIGVVDGDYQGEILLNIRNISNNLFVVRPGDRIAQFVITKICSDKLQLVEEFEYVTSRGEGGFGSTGT